MKVKQSLVLAVAFACVLVGFAYAQDPQEPPPPPPAPNSADQAGLDIQGSRNYLLGPGDVVDVRVFGQPELSGPAQVDGDGNLSSLPFLDTPIKAKCRTDKDVQNDIAAAYAKLIKHPQVSVR